MQTDYLKKTISFLPFLLLFLCNFKIPINQGSINWLDLIIIFSICFLLLEIWKNPQKTTLLKNYFIKNEKIILALVGINLLSIFSALIFSKQLFDSLGFIKSFILLPILFSILFSIVFDENNNQKQTTFFIFFSYASIISTISIIGYFFFNQKTYDYRLAFPFQSPNQLAIFIAPALLIGCSFFKKQSFTFLIIIPLTSLLTALLLTESLGAIIGVSLATSAFFFNWKSRIKIVTSTFFLSLFFFSSIFFNSNQIAKIIKPTGSTDSRLVIWKVASMIAKNNPFGIGIGNFQNYYLEYQKYFPPYPQWAVPHSHNIFFQFLVESGIFSLLFFTILIYYIIKKATKKNLGFDSKVKIALIIYFLFHGSVDVLFWKNDLAFVFWFFLLV